MAWEQLPASLEATKQRRRRRRPGSVRRWQVGGRSAAGQNGVLVVTTAPFAVRMTCYGFAWALMFLQRPIRNDTSSQQVYALG